MDEQKQKLKEVLKGFSKGIIAYYKVYAEITGSITAGLLLSQIAYWWFGPAGEKPFFKTNQEFMSELVMGNGEFKAAKARLVSLGLIGIEHRGMPPKTYYTFNETSILAKISNRAKIDQLGKNRFGANRAKIDQQDGRKSTNKMGENRPHKITDTTTQNIIDNNGKNSQTCLSSADAPERGYQLLIKYGVNAKTAKSIVYEQHTPVESIEEIIKNGLAKQKYESSFVLGPGYIIAALNGARAEGKIIKPTKNSRRLHEEIARTKPFKTVPQSRLSPAEFQRRQRQQIEALKNSEKELIGVS